MLKKSLLLIYIIASMVLLVMGYIFEEPLGSRKYSLIVFATIYALLLLIKLLYRNKEFQKLKSIVVFMMMILLLGMEVYSKYGVNYFYHTLYLLLIFYCITYLINKQAIALSIILTLVSFVKFIQLIMVAPTFANVSVMVFFGSVQILIVVIGLFLRIYRDEGQKTQGLYNELLLSHEQLQAYSDEIKELSQMEERTMIARDLHDTLGHDMTALIMQMEMASHCYDNGDKDEGHKFLMASKQSARESLVKVRAIVETLKKNEGVSTIKTNLKELIDSFSLKTGCQIDFSEKGQVNRALKPEVNLVLYRIVQESLTNALRHGRATLIYVSLIYNLEGLSFIIEDNGVGCEGIEEGNGLSGMRERLSGVGGYLEIKNKGYQGGTQISHGSYRESQVGFIVKGMIPYEREGHI